MAPEEILMAAVRAGGDRKELHEAVRRHSGAAEPSDDRTVVVLKVVAA